MVQCFIATPDEKKTDLVNSRKIKNQVNFASKGWADFFMNIKAIRLNQVVGVELGCSIKWVTEEL